MDSFELNKIAGAVLFALLLSVGLSIFSEVIFHSEAPESPGYVIAVATEGGEATTEAKPFAELLAAADPKVGANSAKKCLACHTFAAGEPNKVGPNLYGVVNRPIAAHEGFEYDPAMHAYAETAKTWTFDNLNTFLHDPQGTVPKTKMAFPGLKNDTERANVIAYLNTLSENPAPLPTAPEQAASAAPEGTATDAAAPAPAEQVAAPEQQVAQTEAPATAPASAPAAAPAAGDPAAGEKFAARCKACHSLAKDGPNMVGPHLFGVVGRPIASVADFNYSEPMKTYSEGGAKVWDEAALGAYLADPKGTIPGNKMAFPGVKKDTDRANLLAYLATLKE